MWEAWNGSEVQSHDMGKRGRSATGAHGSVMGVQNKGVTEGIEKRVGREVQWGHGFMVYYNVWCVFGHENVITQ